MIRALRPLAAAVALGLVLTACGGGDTAEAESPAATSASTEPTPEIVTPTVARATVTPIPYTSWTVDAYDAFGDYYVRSGFLDTTELATKLGFNPDFFLADGDNSLADLDPILARFTPSAAETLRAAAEKCLAEDDAQSCYTIWQAVPFNATNGDAYMPDGSFVVEQTVNGTEVFVNGSNSSGLGVKFQHSAKVRVMSGDEPVGIIMNRALTYGLVRAPEGSKDLWLIDAIAAEFTGTVQADPYTFAPIEEPAA